MLPFTRSWSLSPRGGAMRLSSAANGPRSASRCCLTRRHAWRVSCESWCSHSCNRHTRPQRGSPAGTLWPASPPGARRRNNCDSYGRWQSQSDLLHTLGVRLYFAQEIRSMLEEAGFRDISIEFGFTGLPATPDDEMVADLARP